MPLPWLIAAQAKGDDSKRCAAMLTTRPGERCTAAAVLGANVCWMHGVGRKGSPQRRAIERRLMAEAEATSLAAECEKLGIPRDVDPGPALVEMVKEAAGNVEFYRQRAQELGTEVNDTEPVGERGSKDVAHIRVRMYDAERDRLSNVAALALRAGVEERAVQLAEAEATRLLAGVADAIAAVGLSDAQAEMFRSTLFENLRLPQLGP